MAAAKKLALGRGLGALIDDAEKQSVSNNEFTNEINLDLIDVNPFQPRSTFDEEALLELAASVKQLGIIQPITLREADNSRYQIISGERRTRAAKIAGLKKIPAYIRKANDQEMLEMALVENIQREDLDPIEIALSYRRLMDECQLTQEVLSERVGKKRSTVTNYLRILKLPIEIQKGLRNRKITLGHAKPLVSIENEDLQINTCLKIIEEDLSVRQTEEYVKKLMAPPSSKSKPLSTKSSEYQQLENHLHQFFQSKVQLIRNNNGKGKIVIPFGSDSDLERIIAMFDQLNN